MKPVFLAICLIAAFQSFSQINVSTDPLKTRYENETLHFSNGYISKGLNGERIRWADLKNEFSVSPEGAKEFDRFRKKKTTATILAGLALGCVVTGSIIEHNTPKSTPAAILIGFGIGFEIGTIPYFFGGEKRLHHAIWLRNRDVLFPVK